MKLWLVRHALPLAEEGLCYGAADLPADPQATLRAAEALATLLPTPLAVSCSPLLRCRQLADALRALRPDLEYRLDPRLAEMHFGKWERRRWSDIARDEFDGWMADFPGYRCGGGESVAQLMARVSLAWGDARCGGSDAAWITHAGVVRAVRLLAGGVALPKEAGEWPREGLDFGRAECIELVPGAGLA
jgi:alpha-ribazole phosphatase